MSRVLAESHVEEAALAWLAEIGYQIAYALDPDGPSPERAHYGETLLVKRLQAALTKLNPSLSPENRAEVISKLQQSANPSPIEENRRLHRYLVEGVPIEVPRADGSIGGEHVRLLDFDNPAANDWLAANQVTIVENKARRRPDVLIFVNGLPLGVIELKNPGDKNATLDGAHRQLQTYKSQLPSLFRLNAVLVISDGIAARVGSLTASRERFMPWRSVTGESLAAKSTPELETLVRGVFDQRRFLDLVKDFIVFGDSAYKPSKIPFGETGSGVAKILAGYHQFYAVRHAVERTLDATGPEGDRRVGVVWHTQGSGKSLLMAFYAGQVIKHPAMQNPTLVVLTDRNDLDDQLFGTFCMCKDLLRQTPQQATDRAHLRELLDRPAGGVIFTTLQKFSPEEGSTELPVLTDRRNVVVIADEAHRSQYGFAWKMDKSGTVSLGFAANMRAALPNASFIGFTGTPIEKDDANTRGVFGDYIDIYDISRAVADEATVPIYYESRLARIELDPDEKPKIDAEVAEITDDVPETERERLKRKQSGVEALVGAEKRLALIAADLVAHFENRLAAMPDGKAMIVCMSRRICVALYNQLVALRPDWHSDDDDVGAVKIVMTGAASDPSEWQAHLGTKPKTRRDLIAKRAKNPDDVLRLVIVCDMWLTGFDAPCMNTMYVDKPMKDHGLMQAIARVNRVFRTKKAGLIVDYIGIAQLLKNALSRYSGPDQGETGIDIAVAIQVLLERYEVVKAMYRPNMPSGFDYRPALDPTTTPQARLTVMAGAIDWVLTMQQEEAASELTEEGKKRAHRRYADAVLALQRAFALAAASDEAVRIREEVGFFQAIRAALLKSGPNGKVSTADRELALQQLVSRAVVSTEIVDIMRAAGLDTPDISILSDEFLAEMRDFQHRNLAVEALRKLLNGQVQSQGQRNVTQAKAFTERLEEAMARYHANAITTAEILEELIALAKEIRAERERGESSGLSDEELAFYDALAENESAREAMGDPKLRVIAHELVQGIKGGLSIDWIHREAARARIRVLVKKILRKYGYPPDLQDAAVQNVLQQAEALSAEWAPISANQ